MMDSAEIWIPVVGYENCYEVSSCGRIRGVARTDAIGRPRAARELLAHPSARGYRHLMLCKDGVRRDFRVARLVLAAFVGPCPIGMEAAHENGDNGDDRLSNLRWDTHIANVDDKRKHGTMARGERQGRSKLTSAKVLEIVALKRSGAKSGAIAKQFGITRQRVWQLSSGYRESWSHLDLRESR